jgi:hypothetical protein
MQQKKENMSVLKLEYRVMCKDDVDPVSQLIAECFTKYNAPTVYLEMTFDELFVYCQSVIRQIAQFGLSFVAEDQESGKILGASVVFDHNLELPDTILSPNLKLIYEYLDVLDNQAFGKLGHKFMNGECAFIALGASSIEINGKGIFRQVLTHSLAAAKTQGFKFLYAQSTNPLTTKALKAIGGEGNTTILTSFPYASFVNTEGVEVFEHLEGCADGVLVKM